MNRIQKILWSMVNPSQSEVGLLQASNTLQAITTGYAVEEQTNIVFELHRLLIEKREQEVKETETQLALLKKDLERLKGQHTL